MVYPFKWLQSRLSRVRALSQWGTRPGLRLSHLHTVPFLRDEYWSSNYLAIMSPRSLNRSMTDVMDDKVLILLLCCGIVVGIEPYYTGYAKVARPQDDPSAIDDTNEWVWIGFDIVRIVVGLLPMLYSYVTPNRLIVWAFITKGLTAFLTAAATWPAGLLISTFIGALPAVILDALPLYLALFSSNKTISTRLAIYQTSQPIGAVFGPVVARSVMRNLQEIAPPAITWRLLLVVSAIPSAICAIIAATAFSSSTKQLDHTSTVYLALPDRDIAEDRSLSPPEPKWQHSNPDQTLLSALRYSDLWCSLTISVLVSLSYSPMPSFWELRGKLEFGMESWYLSTVYLDGPSSLSFAETCVLGSIPYFISILALLLTGIIVSKDYALPSTLIAFYGSLASTGFLFMALRALSTHTLSHQYPGTFGVVIGFLGIQLLTSIWVFVRAPNFQAKCLWFCLIQMFSQTGRLLAPSGVRIWLTADEPLHVKGLFWGAGCMVIAVLISFGHRRFARQ